MKIRYVFLLFLGLASPGVSRTLLGMNKSLAGEISPAAAKRQTGELLADLSTLPDAALSPAGWTIKNILLGNRAAVSPQDLTTVYTAPGPLDSSECRRETCCVWKYIADAMATSFRDGAGRCNELARQAVRLGFHDAGTWSKSAGVWDTLYYNQTASSDPPQGVFRFPSDLALSQYPPARELWQTFANAQAVWNDDFAAAYVHLSVLGVEHINDLTECTGVLPLSG